MPRCVGIKRDGGRCAAIVDGSYCYQHDPVRAGERRRNAARAARSRPSRELARIKQRLSDLADDVLEGSVEKSVAAVASQILNVYLRAIELERKIRETDELEARLEALEQTQEGGRAWGA